MTVETARGSVVLYSGEAACDPASHETVTRAAIAQRIASLRGYDYAGEYDPGHQYRGPLYVVPAQTLLQTEAHALGIRSEDDLFGGVVPHPFIATKTITHPLVSLEAFAPAGWSHDFAVLLSDVVLAGFSAYTVADARIAAQRLLKRGAVRIKPARSVGGNGQAVITNIAELDAVFEAMDLAELADHGVVVEENLTSVVTYSVGQVYLADMWISYHGTQRLTPNHKGAEVYGGSDLIVIRGQFDSLLHLDLAPEIRLAVEQARRYDSAAVTAFPQLLASRRNYDIARGRDGVGHQRSGVLEQSWRLGGASSAEIAALEAFVADPQLHAVRASSWEFFGMPATPPQANVYYRGIDGNAGAMTKYSILEAYGNSA